MIITVSGMAGSGKSTLAKNLAQALGFKHYSAGDLTRAYAKEKDMTLIALQQLEAKDPAIDKEIDARSVLLANKNKNFVLDAWLGFHFLPHSVKIYLTVDREEAARRIFHAMRSDEQYNTSLEATRKKMQERIAVNKERWQRYYGVDIEDRNNYDLLIDTTHKEKEEVLKEALAFVEKTEAKK